MPEGRSAAHDRGSTGGQSAVEDGGPVVLDAHHRPALSGGRLERLLRPGRVVELPIRIVVQDEQPQGGPILPAGGPEHRDIAVRVPAREDRDKFEAVLNRALTGEEVDFHALIAKQKIIRPLYQAYTGEKIPTQIRFDNKASEERTVIEIETEDRIGLLYSISQTLTDLNLDISAAKINTEKGAAIDIFYIREVDGGKILSPERHRAIERKLRQAIQALDQVK